MESNLRKSSEPLRKSSEKRRKGWTRRKKKQGGVGGGRPEKRGEGWVGDDVIKKIKKKKRKKEKRKKKKRKKETPSPEKRPHREGSFGTVGFLMDVRRYKPTNGAGEAG